MNWYKIHKVSSKGIISFDFDDTLTLPEWSEEDEIWINRGPRSEIIEKMRQYYKDGFDIIIVTSRYDFDMAEVENFVHKYGLPVSEIYNTSGANKGPLLKQLGVIKHFDDAQHEIDSAKEYNIETERVWHPQDLKLKDDKNGNKKIVD